MFRRFSVLELFPSGEMEIFIGVKVVGDLDTFFVFDG